MTGLCLILLAAGAYTQENKIQLIDSLLLQLSSVSDTYRIELLNELSKNHWTISLEKSIEYAQQALEIAKRLNYQQGIADAINRMGNAYSAIAVYDKAIDYYQEALTIRNAIRDKKGLAQSHSNLGICFYYVDEQDKSIEHFREQIKIAHELQDDTLLASGFHNLGELYSYLGNTSSAIELLDTCLILYEKIGDFNQFINISKILGQTYLSVGNPEKAISTYTKASEKCIQVRSTGNLAYLQNHIGMIFLRNGDYDHAREFFLESKENAMASNERSQLADVYKSLSDYYSEKGNLKEAYEFYKLHSELNDSLFRNGLDKKLAQLQVQFDTESKEQEIEFLRKNEEIEMLGLQKDRNFRNFLIILVVVLFTVSLSSVYILSLKRKTTIILQHQKQLQEKTNIQLLTSEKTQQEINLTKSKFFSIIAHDLINPFNALLGFTELLADETRNLNRKEIKKYSGIIYQSSKNLHQLLQNLLQWSRTNRGNIDFHPDHFDLNKTIHHLVSILEITAGKKNIEVRTELKTGIIVYADENHVSTILRNLVNNAIKFTMPDGLVIISTRDKNGFIEICVKDNGIGLCKEDQEKLFRIDTHFTRKGTANEHGTGLGLIVSKDFVEKNGGEISVESEENNGSSFRFTLPKNPDT